MIEDIEHEVMPLRVSDLQRLINRRFVKMLTPSLPFFLTANRQIKRRAAFIGLRDLFPFNLIKCKD
jgi:hypothetical protein